MRSLVVASTIENPTVRKCNGLVKFHRAIPGSWQDLVDPYLYPGTSLGLFVKVK